MNTAFVFLNCRPGPNAPIQWVKDCVLTLSPEKGKQRSKILLGLNFYGQDFAPMGGGRMSFYILHLFKSAGCLSLDFKSYLFVGHFFVLFFMSTLNATPCAAILGSR